MPVEKKKNEKVIKKKTRVSVSNTLNQMIFEQKDLNLQAFRMVMFYLAKINPKRPDFTEVRVPLETYAEMLGVELNEQAIDASTDLLMGYTLKFGERIEGEYRVKSAKYNIFSKCRLLERMSDGKRILEFKCSDDIKPLIFELQEKFTGFNVWNVLNLSNFQDIRMYMLLSQYKVAGAKTFTLEELKDKLGISKDSYPEYKEFARTVLKKCQKALGEKTDIRFEFKSIGRPAHSVKFDVFKNTEYTILKYLAEENPKPQDEDLEQTTIFDEDEYIAAEQKEELEAAERYRRQELCEGFQFKEFDEFTYEQLVELKELAAPHIKLEDLQAMMSDGNSDLQILRQQAMHTYIKHKILMANSAEDVKNRYKYIRAAVKDNWK